VLGALRVATLPLKNLVNPGSTHRRHPGGFQYIMIAKAMSSPSTAEDLNKLGSEKTLDRLKQVYDMINPASPSASPDMSLFESLFNEASKSRKRYVLELRLI
jgi:hypothetical protein